MQHGASGTRERTRGSVCERDHDKHKHKPKAKKHIEANERLAIALTTKKEAGGERQEGGQVCTIISRKTKRGKRRLKKRKGSGQTRDTQEKERKWNKSTQTDRPPKKRQPDSQTDSVARHDEPGHD